MVKFDFQEGFVNDIIILKINGNEVLKKDNVTTDLSISLAESFSIELLNGQLKLDIVIPSKNLSLSQTIIIDSEKYCA